MSGRGCVDMLGICAYARYSTGSRRAASIAIGMILHDADNRRRLSGCSADRFSERIFAGEMSAREPLADNRHLRRSRRSSEVEIAPPQQRNAHRLEYPGLALLT